MLQRPQSILLLLVAIAMVLFLATDTWHKTGVGESASLNPYFLTYSKDGSVLKNTPIYYIALMAVLSAGLSIFTIFQYKNRLRQMLLVSLNSLVGAGVLGATIYQIQYKANLLFNPEVQGEFSISFWAVFAALLFNWIANRLIRRDEKMVKESDRMR